jgi:hypothetical protein
MPRRKAKRRKVVSHAAYAKMLRQYKHRGEGLSRERDHIPTRVLESYLAKMPRHMQELANLIKRRRAAGE